MPAQRRIAHGMRPTSRLPAWPAIPDRNGHPADASSPWSRRSASASSRRARIPTAAWSATWRATAQQPVPLPATGSTARRRPSLLTTPASGAVYPLKESVAAAYACADGGSGALSCAGTVANGAPIDTSSTGTRTFVVNTADAVGNSSTATVTYTVKRMLTAVGPAKAWVGLKNNGDAGLRVDLRAQVLVNGVVAAIGEVPMFRRSRRLQQRHPAVDRDVTAERPVEVPRFAVVSLRVEARRTCSGGGPGAGTVRERYNGDAIEQWPTARRRQPRWPDHWRPGRRAVPAAAVPSPAERRQLPVVRRS